MSQARAKGSTRRALRNDVNGFDSVEEKDGNVSVKQGKITYALMPVWLLNTKWDGQDFKFAMNGQTGKLVGDLPLDKGKATGTFIGILVACLVLLLGILGVDAFIGVIISVIIPLVVVGSMKSALKSVATAQAADTYVGNVKITHRAQNFTHETEEKRKIDND